MMKVPDLNRCCFCFPLRCGIILFAFINIKEIAMLRLYNYYAVATSLAAIIPSFFLVSRRMYTDSAISFFAIALQCYVIVLVRSDVVKLEEKLFRQQGSPHYSHSINIVSDTVTLL
ncbi:unnamed protein product [Leptidea sinapis]|uniref:Uncharacterized protein n=1 Tax=Leptidea sinapis TaxID=189913 RepID=A0A5E4QJW8_9NEOP|nr:unnamed protein product [Leptidea sinapis]